MHSETELLAVRLARMKALVESLEVACSDSAENRDMLAKLKAEMLAARDGLNPAEQKR